MRRASFPALHLCACGLGAWVLGAAPAAGQGLTHSGRAGFSIPFRVGAADLAAAGATEARLLVSVDGGRRWDLAGSAAPGDGDFRFDAPADGDYWFTVLTVDAAGRPAPADAELVPQLHVRVDRAAPAVSVDAAPLGDGTVAVSWRVADPAADPDTLAVTFTPDGGAPQPVPVAAGLTGSFRIPADAAAGTVAVEVKDPAGNVGSASRRTGGTDFVPVAQGSSAPPASLPELTPLPAPAPLPLETSAAMPTFRGVPAVRQNRAAPAAADEAGPAVADVAPVLKDRRFKVGYAVDAVGSSGVGKVELFITPDGGTHWYSYGVDADRRSPAEVEVPGDGEYGFTVRVSSGAGLAAAPPKSGDAPDVRVTVDGTPPAVEILSAGQGRGEDANTLSVAWRIRDDRPDAAPVKIELGTGPAGPWEVVRDWSADAGSAVVPVRPGVPAKLYVRVTARDAAGNERAAVTPEGVAVDLARPTARVIGVVR